MGIFAKTFEFGSIQVLAVRSRDESGRPSVLYMSDISGDRTIFTRAEVFAPDKALIDEYRHDPRGLLEFLDASADEHFQKLTADNALNAYSEMYAEDYRKRHNP